MNDKQVCTVVEYKQVCSRNLVSLQTTNVSSLVVASLITLRHDLPMTTVFVGQDADQLFVKDLPLGCILAVVFLHSQLELLM